MIVTDQTRNPTLSDVLIEVLVCPIDHADLEQREDELVCQGCGRRYPIDNGVPNMLVDGE